MATADISHISFGLIKHANAPSKSKKLFLTDIVWRNVIIFVILHWISAYACIYLWKERRPEVYFFGQLFGTTVGMGVTAGAHRLWSHRAYKARFPMRVVLMILQTIAFQNCIYEWCRDHRTHHKFSDTDADPHNSKRGFFFSHIGWLMLRKHPDVKEKGKQIDLSDLETDPVVMFQKKYYLIMMPLLAFAFPTVLAHYIFGMNYWYSFVTVGVLRYVMSLHYTWMINSVAHTFGNRPFDEKVSATDSLTTSIIACGEGWHNYHHVFPWDYKAAELGGFSTNFTCWLIDQCAKIGQAYDLKTASAEIVKRRVQRTGDGSHPDIKQKKEDSEKHTMVWGWEDKDMTESDKKLATRL
ncbi:SCD family protein [Megaselia abdita]